MTTTVVISSPEPNHENLKVCAYYTDGNGNLATIHSDATLTDGESVTLHVHGSMKVLISEVQKPKPEPVPVPDEPAPEPDHQDDPAPADEHAEAEDSAPEVHEPETE